ncbi:MAG TPA: DEAD/DEAH box helicase [Jatrophihabitans sp.]|nr:DEAD/DEAH box helicase [Jatrophihabitans sp.]
MPASLTTVLAGLGIATPTPIQAATLPDSLAGRDVLGRGRTGSGKTYAFLLPLVARLATDRTARRRGPRALVLAPTRELVGQIEASLAPLARASGLTYLTVFGGVSQRPQVSALSRGVDIVIACPGRLEDLIGQKHCSLAEVEITVLDEADHMADLGFLPAVRRLLGQTPRGGQRLLFSATLDQAIDTLVRQFLTRPVTHQADSVQAPVSAMSHHILHIEREHRLSILLDLTSAPGRTMVFTRTKHGAQGLARQLNRGGVPAVDLHGNLGQNARTRNLDAFHAGTATVLVATDIAARGIHVDDVTLVVHADPPAEHKAYLHRSGRTARAGNAGTVVTLMTGEQVKDVRDLVRAAGIAPITTRVKDNAHPILAELAPGDRALRGPFQTSAQPEPHPAQQSTKGRQQRRSSARGTDQAGTTTPRARASSTSTRARASSTSKPSGNEKAAAPSRGGRRSAARTPGARHSAAAFSSGRR